METAELVHAPKRPMHPAVIETASTAVAAQMDAAIRARYSLAMARPRDIDNVRVKILKACARPQFAETAIYKVPRAGKSIEGPSIRFAEEVARDLGNLSIDSSIIHDDAERRIVRVTVVDVEANLPYSQDVVIEKFVERRQLPSGATALSTRVNSSGDVLYRLPSNEDDLLMKQAALTSKAVRTLVLRVLPGDILDEAIKACKTLRTSELKKDPAAAKKKLVDGFAEYAVMPTDLKAFLGHDLEYVDDKELEELRDIYHAIKEGETNWGTVMEAKRPAKESAVAVAASAPSSMEALAAKRKTDKAAKSATTAAPPAATTPPAAQAPAAAPLVKACEACHLLNSHEPQCPNNPNRVEPPEPARRSSAQPPATGTRIKLSDGTYANPDTGEIQGDQIQGREPGADD